MGWKQIKSFDPSKMGTRKGWCLQNVRLGFGISKGTMPSAKADMEFNKSKGALHPMSEYPSNCAVPVYLDTTSPYDHVICDDHGTLWSDGKRLSSLNGFTVYGWGEYCDTVRVVEKTPDPVPPTPSGFLPAKGYWGPGDNDQRVAQISSFMRKVFPAYTSAKALGPYYGPYLSSSILEFQKRCGMSKKDCDSCVGPKTLAKLEQYGFQT